MKKGYTLIELVAAMFILGIIFSFSFSGYNLYKSFEENIKIENFLYELEDTFCYGRDYCKNNGVIGTIKLREYEDKFVISFSTGGDTKIKRELEKSIMIDKDFVLAYPIVDSYDISKYGIVQSKTTLLKDSRNNKYQLSINPTVNNVYVGKRKNS